jgi:hypothetical protein
VLAAPSLTRRMFESVDARVSGQAGGAGGRTTLQALQAADQAWYNLRHMEVRLTEWLRHTQRHYYTSGECDAAGTAACVCADTGQ